MTDDLSAEENAAIHAAYDTLDLAERADEDMKTCQRRIAKARSILAPYVPKQDRELLDGAGR